MRSTIRNTMAPAALALACAAVLSLPAAALAGEAPIKEIVTSHTGGFSFAKGIAGGPAPNGNVYVADGGNNRVQELNAGGEFVLMFGAAPTAVAVDPSSGNVYVAEPSLGRISEFTAAGQFVLMIGKEVNETTKGDVCSEKEIKAEAVKCKAGKFVGLGTTEHYAFVNPQVVAAGGPEDLLYVGDEHRVQEFESNGKYKGEIREPLEAISPEGFSDVSSIAVDKTGDVYLLYTVSFVRNVIHEFDVSGKEIKAFPGVPREPGATVSFGGIAVDPAGRLAVSEAEGVNFRGSLYEVGSAGLRLLTEFVDPFTERGIAFNGNDQLYAVSGAEGQEVTVYTPVPVGEFVGAPVQCVPGVEHETDATFDCALNGEVDAWGVKETQVWFQWGRTPLFGEKTGPPSPVVNAKGAGEEETLVKVSAPIQALRPNETFYYRLAGEDHNVKTPELLTSTGASFVTPAVAPRIVGGPSVSAVKSLSVVLFSEVNPENANTTYEFQYGACENLENCTARQSTPIVESAAYGTIGTVAEVTGLQPSTVYRYRLLADSENKQHTEKYESKGPEASFTTAPAPVPHAVTGPPSTIGSTSAVISGNANPDGRQASYAFEVGVYAGADTQYGIVFSGQAGAGIIPVEERLGLTGLQPGTEYAYRITIKSGYGAETGATATFTTEGLPAVLFSPPVLAQLAVPAIAFPGPVSPAKTKNKKTKTKKSKKGGAKKSNAHKKPHRGKK
jgi:DNA-binding beta-propeller fold protein YncE